MGACEPSFPQPHPSCSSEVVNAYVYPTPFSAGDPKTSPLTCTLFHLLGRHAHPSTTLYPSPTPPTSPPIIDTNVKSAEKGGLDYPTGYDAARRSRAGSATSFHTPASITHLIPTSNPRALFDFSASFLQLYPRATRTGVPMRERFSRVNVNRQLINHILHSQPSHAPSFSLPRLQGHRISSPPPPSLHPLISKLSSHFSPLAGSSGAARRTTRWSRVCAEVPGADLPLLRCPFFSCWTSASAPPLRRTLAPDFIVVATGSLRDARRDGSRQDSRRAASAERRATRYPLTHVGRGFSIKWRRISN